MAIEKEPGLLGEKSRNSEVELDPNTDLILKDLLEAPEIAKRKLGSGVEKMYISVGSLKDAKAIVGYIAKNEHSLGGMKINLDIKRAFEVSPPNATHIVEIEMNHEIKRVHYPAVKNEMERELVFKEAKKEGLLEAWWHAPHLDGSPWTYLAVKAVKGKEDELFDFLSDYGLGIANASYLMPHPKYGKPDFQIHKAFTN